MYTADSLPWYGWVILGIVLIAIIAGILWFTWLGRFPRLPSGRRSAFESDGRMTTVVAQPGTELVLINGLAVSCGQAVRAAATAWEYTFKKSPDVISNVVIYFTTDRYFDQQQYQEIRNAAAYLVYTGARVGAGVPMAVIRERYAAEVASTGEPVIHEMIHAMLGDFSEPDKDRDHSNKSAWATFGDDTVQARARKLFKAYPVLG